MQIDFLENGTYLWLTDLHLDMAEEDRVDDLLEQLKQKSCKGIFITGDIGEQGTFASFLRKIKNSSQAPVYFILGNHDYYGNSIAQIQEEAKILSETSKNLFCLSELDPISCDDFALIGLHNFNDGRDGNFEESQVWLRDYSEIEEFISLTPQELQLKLQNLGQQTSLEAKAKLKKAFQMASKVVLLVHVPPFREACLYQNQMADQHWAPHFACCTLGNTLLQVMEAHPDKELLVLCGHTHHWADFSPLPNLRVLAGHAEYGSPCFQFLNLLEP